MKGITTAHAVRRLNSAAANRLTTVSAQTDELDCESNLTFDGSTLTVTGNLTVTGTTTTVSSTNTVVADQLIELGNGRSGSASGDAGIIVERGSDTNAALIWDESADTWSACTTAATGASTGDLTLTAANLNAAVVTCTGVTIGSAAITETELEILDGATLSTTELNYVDGVTSAIQTQLDAKQAADADLTALSSCQSGGAAALAALTATEIAILDGATLTTTELNYVDGVSSAIQTQLDGKSPVAGHSSIATVGTIGTGVWQGTAIANAYVADLPTSKITSGTFADGRIASSNVTQHQGSITATGALNGGSITSGFGNIDNGSSSVSCGAVTASGVVDVTDTTDASDATGDTGALRCEGGASIAKKLYVGTDLDVAGTANLDAVDIDGAVQLDGALTVGANDQGYDVTLHGNTASANVMWDTSSDDLIFSGAAALVVPEGQLVLGNAAVTSTAAELNLLDGVAGLVQADLTKLAAVDSTAAELNLLDGGASVGGSITIADTDGFIINDGGTMKTVPASDLKTYAGGGGGAADDESQILHAITLGF